MHRVLVIDDSAMMRTHVRATLAGARVLGESVEVVETASGFEALRLLHQGAFDVVIVDIHLPDIDGLELLRFIRQSPNHRDVGLVIISTLSSTRDRERAFRLGAHAFVAKPFSAEAITSAIQRSLTASRESRARITT